LDILRTTKGVMLLTVDLCDGQLVPHLLRKLDPCWSELLAVPAPRGKEFDECPTFLDLVGEVSFVEFKNLAFWVQNACWGFRLRRGRCVYLWNKVLVEIFLDEFGFPCLFERVDEFAILVNVELWPPGDLQLLTFI